MQAPYIRVRCVASECNYYAHSSGMIGNYCCRKCRGDYSPGPGAIRGHGQVCERVRVPLEFQKVVDTTNLRIRSQGTMNYRANVESEYGAEDDAEEQRRQHLATRDAQRRAAVQARRERQIIYDDAEREVQAALAADVEALRKEDDDRRVEDERNEALELAFRQHRARLGVEEARRRAAEDQEAQRQEAQRQNDERMEQAYHDEMARRHEEAQRRRQEVEDQEAQREEARRQEDERQEATERAHRQHRARLRAEEAWSDRLEDERLEERRQKAGRQRLARSLVDEAKRHVEAEARFDDEGPLWRPSSFAQPPSLPPPDHLLRKKKPRLDLRMTTTYETW